MAGMRGIFGWGKCVAAIHAQACITAMIKPLPDPETES